MNLAGSVRGDERVRLFCALPLPERVLDVLGAWQDEHVLGARRVARANLHVTLAFLGSTPRDRLGEVVRELHTVAAAARRPRLEPIRYRETRSVGMLVLSDDGGAAGLLAAALRDRLERLGVYRRERRPWLPHVTVARFREPPHLRPPLPATGAITPSEAAAYLSVLRPGGAEYVVLETAALGGP